jgi:sensor domain CHASE-containing protein
MERQRPPNEPIWVMLTQGAAGDRRLQGIVQGRFQVDRVADAEKEKSYAKNRLQPAKRATGNN